MKNFKFDNDIALTRTDENSFATVISPDYNIAAPNGGYLLALAGNAMKLTSKRYKTVLSMSAYYHRPTATGPAQLIVREVAKNKRIRTASVSLQQGGREIITYIGAFSTANAFDGISFSSRPDDEVPPFEDCTQIGAIPFPFYKQVNLFMPLQQFEWAGGKKSEEAWFSGYFEFADGRPLDDLAVLLFVDATPPPILRRLGPLAWVPTIELTAQVRKIPTGTRLKFLSQTNYATDGLVETDIELWDESGDIVALARQLATVKETI